MTESGNTEQLVIVNREGRGVQVTLNRPRAINALTTEMLDVIEDALTLIENGDVEVLFIDGAGERGLCAGGDVTMNLRFNRDQMADFWMQEHDIIRRITQSKIPIVTFQDGITMGGGIGLSSHASHRIVTERTRIAMPETRIGFIPDVGGSLLLAHAPGRLGLHLGLTAGDMSASDAIACGFSDTYIESQHLEALKHQLLHGTKDIASTIDQFASAAPASQLLAQRSWIDEAYVGETVADILGNLEARNEPEAAKAAEAIRQMSPNALEMAYFAYQRAEQLDDLNQVLAMELAIGREMFDTPDMQEGVRAHIVDKDFNPQWQPATLDGVDHTWIQRVGATAVVSH